MLASTYREPVGQAYVAISRATSLEGLQIIGFQASKVYAHPAVIEWSKTLTN
jgi:ATP-dependent DNA helicase PIF1